MNSKSVLVSATLAMALSAAYATSLSGTRSSHLQSNGSGQTSDKQATSEPTEGLKEQREKTLKTNELIDQVNTDMNAKRWKEAADGLQRLIAIDSTHWEFYSSLSTAQMNLGQYQDSIDSAEKGIKAARNDKGSNSDHAKIKVGIGQMLTTEGNSYLKMHKDKEAVAAFSKAAEDSPNPGTAYFNLCATLYNMGNAEGTIAACDKAIAVDPSKADAYFIKGSVLIGDSKTNSKGELQAAPGTVEALKKYLELAPNGGHAGDVKEMLKMVGVTVPSPGKKP